ncbi:ParA family protein [Methylophilus sp. 13]|uniref:ParA family protein n=1 Tax=Methylophilus sp. 13 TaxID=2781018 RepID=UPI00188FDDDB|nr:ParA family protein [Methylophilus sp. 13]MBF5039571.1 ParA family protein [Methylophilus sp. 13]
MLKIAILNQKAGVGATTTALNLAAAYQRKQRPALLLDMDPQARLTEIYKHTGLNVQSSLLDFYERGTAVANLVQALRNGLQLITANHALSKLDSQFGRGPATLSKLNAGLDTLAQQQPALTVVMDCCPYMGVISLSAVFASDLVVVPVTTDYLSIHSAVRMDKALNALQPVLKRKIARRYLLTRAESRKSMTTEVEQEMRRLFGQELLMTKIGEHAALSESLRMGQHVFEYDAQSAAAHDYLALYFELQDVSRQLNRQPLATLA